MALNGIKLISTIFYICKTNSFIHNNYPQINYDLYITKILNQFKDEFLHKKALKSHLTVKASGLLNTNKTTLIILFEIFNLKQNAK